MGFSIPTGGFGTGIEIGSIYAKVGADVSDFNRGMAGAAATMKTTAAVMRSSGDSIGADGEKSGRRVRNGMRDAEKALSGFDRAAKWTARNLNGGPLGLVGALGTGISAVFKFGGMISDGVTQLADFAKQGEQAGTMMTTFGTTMAALANPIGAVVTAVTLAVGALLILPIAAAVASAALYVLITLGTTLAAAFTALVGPVGVLVGLLGLLSGGFFLAFKTAMQGNGVFGPFAEKIGRLKGQFAGLLRTLGQDFLPVFWKVAQVAQVAVNYFDKLSHMSLADAFKSLSTTGVQKLSSLMKGIGSLLAKPFRLAIDLAFGSGGSNLQRAAGNLWTKFTNYLFGYSKRNPFILRKESIKLQQSSVAGALQPIVTWFNSLHLTKTATRWANEIWQGLKTSSAWANFTAYVGTVAANAGSIAGKAFESAFMAELTSLPWQIGAAISGAQGPALTVDHHHGVHNPSGIPTGPIGRGGGVGAGGKPNVVIHVHASAPPMDRQSLDIWGKAVANSINSHTARAYG